MQTEPHLLYEDLTYRLRGCFFNVYNALGFGHKEGVYQKALATELNNQGIHFDQEKSLKVLYRSSVVGMYRPDFVVEGKVLVELKAQEFIPKEHETQLLHYLKTTGFQLGFLVNFGAKRIDIRRKIWSPTYPRKQSSV